MNFWGWLFGYPKGPAGLRRFVDRWMFLHVAIGVIAGFIVPVSLKDAANTVLLPLAGILVGLSFAWGGNAQSLLQTPEIERLAEHHDGGLKEYVFVYQTAVLTIMICLVSWAFAGMNVFDETWPGADAAAEYRCVRFVLFSLSSIALRECWHVVLGAQFLLLSRARIQKTSPRDRE